MYATKPVLKSVNNIITFPKPPINSANIAVGKDAVPNDVELAILLTQGKLAIDKVVISSWQYSKFVCFYQNKIVTNLKINHSRYLHIVEVINSNYNFTDTTKTITRITFNSGLEDNVRHLPVDQIMRFLKGEHSIHSFDCDTVSKSGVWMNPGIRETRHGSFNIRESFQYVSKQEGGTLVEYRI